MKTIIFIATAFIAFGFSGPAVKAAPTPVPVAAATQSILDTLQKESQQELANPLAELNKLVLAKVEASQQKQ